MEIIITLIFVAISLALIVFNVAKKDDEFSKINVIGSVLLPVAIYLINWIIIQIKVSSHYKEISVYNDISSYIMIITIIVEVGILLYLFKKNKLNRIWPLGIIITIVNCYLVWYISTGVSLTITSEVGFSYEEIYEEIKNTIGISMIFSVLDLNIFTLLAVKNKDCI